MGSRSGEGFCMLIMRKGGRKGLGKGGGLWKLGRKAIVKRRKNKIEGTWVMGLGRKGG